MCDKQCDPQAFMNLFAQNKKIADKKLMQAEILVRIGCPVFNNFIRALNQYAIDQNRRRMEIEFPTTTEGDR